MIAFFKEKYIPVYAGLITMIADVVPSEYVAATAA